VTEPTRTQPGASYATRRGFGAITRGEGLWRVFTNVAPTVVAAEAFADRTVPA